VKLKGANIIITLVTSILCWQECVTDLSLRPQSRLQYSTFCL